MPRLIPLSCAILILATTSVFSTQDSVDLPVAQLPPPVTAALMKKYPTAKAESAQKSEERNDYIYYYVTLAQGKERTIVTVTEVGEIVSTAPVK